MKGYSALLTIIDPCGLLARFGLVLLSCDRVSASNVGVPKKWQNCLEKFT